MGIDTINSCPGMTLKYLISYQIIIIIKTMVPKLKTKIR
jgi:hypothetical protein